ncbi:hypothetical protein ABW19_dt0205382 [Dactylella cylindrospora]|nr:hypothetical protein ABW19_dt0205382 [Dactylella cylindrospora]
MPGNDVFGMDGWNGLLQLAWAGDRASSTKMANSSLSTSSSHAPGNTVFQVENGLLLKGQQACSGRKTKRRSPYRKYPPQFYTLMDPDGDTIMSNAPSYVNPDLRFLASYSKAEMNTLRRKIYFKQAHLPKLPCLKGKRWHMSKRRRFFGMYGKNIKRSEGRQKEFCVQR